MAVPNGGNQIARRVIDDLIEFKMESLDDQGEMFDTLMDPRDDREAANTKLQGSVCCLCYEAQTEEHSFSVVIRDFYFELRVALIQNQRLIGEMEALG
ncbi:hypothetical protein Tco_1424089 [Tanacetum coccineum]